MNLEVLGISRNSQPELTKLGIPKFISQGELCEIIYKHFLTIKLKKREALGWNLVHNELLKQSFCHIRQQLVRIIICLEFNNCHWEGLFYPCFKQEIKHKVLYTPPIENIPLVTRWSVAMDFPPATPKVAGAKFASGISRNSKKPLKMAERGNRNKSRNAPFWDLLALKTIQRESYGFGTIIPSR